MRCVAAITNASGEVSIRIVASHMCCVPLRAGVRRATIYDGSGEPLIIPVGGQVEICGAKA